MSDDVDIDLLDLSMALPDPLRGAGRVFLWTREEASLESLKLLAQNTGHPCETFDAHGCVAISVRQDDIVQFLGVIRRDLPPRALEETRALFKPGLQEPRLSDLPRAESLRAFIIFARGKWLGEIMTEGRLSVHFQPIVPAHDLRSIFGHEALARGRGRDRQSVHPVRMLSAARDAGLLSTFETSVHQLAARRLTDARSQSKLFLNLTPGTAADPEFELGHFKRLCNRYPIATRDLVIEVTESDKIHDTRDLSELVREAQQEGFLVALDDLGAGFSNLNLIHQLRPDIVKLDMALTRRIHEDEYRAVIAQKIIELSQGLGIRTVAEGVELPEELDWLREHGIDYVQGFYVGRPDELPRDTIDLQCSDSSC
ncbi:MAG: EAL domain-containing protein [Myxococcota bacterium]